MPDWCTNEVSIEAVNAEGQKQVAELVKLMGLDRDEPEFNFAAIIPHPDEVKKAQAEFDAEQKKLRPEYTDGYAMSDALYRWQSDAWGTKWDVGKRIEEHNINPAEGNVWLIFMTAWAPPEPVLQALAERFPLVEISNQWQVNEHSGYDIYRS